MSWRPAAARRRQEHLMQALRTAGKRQCLSHECRGNTRQGRCLTGCCRLRAAMIGRQRPLKEPKRCSGRPRSQWLRVVTEGSSRSRKGSGKSRKGRGRTRKGRDRARKGVECQGKAVTKGGGRMRKGSDKNAASEGSERSRKCSDKSQ